MATDNLLFASVSQLAKGIRDGQYSSEQVVQAHLDRIDRVNPAINAVCQLDADNALSKARDADAKLKQGITTGPLHGVPVTIKDSISTAGIITTGGTLGRQEHVPEEDATVVARLRAAGAIILGKTNTPELTLSYETDNLIYGRTNNPFDLTRTPGGSSGGAAAILAAGGSPLDIGSDTAGSIRAPAHFCGVAGIKPTSGRVSRFGHIIPPGGPVGAWTQIGPMARTVGDLILALPLIAGPDGKDPEVVPVPMEDPSAVRLSSLRAAFYTDQGKQVPSKEIVQAVKDSAKYLSEAGCDVKEELPEKLVNAIVLTSQINVADGGAYYIRLLQEYGTKKIHPELRNFLVHADANQASAAEYSRLLTEWSKVKQAMLQFAGERQLIICPVCSSTAPKHGQSGAIDYTYSMVYNLLGWPAAAVPAGFTDDGLPYGIQIVGRPWKEHEVFAAAQYLESRFNVTSVAASRGFLQSIV